MPFTPVDFSPASSAVTQLQTTRQFLPPTAGLLLASYAVATAHGVTRLFGTATRGQVTRLFGTTARGQVTRFFGTATGSEFLKTTVAAQASEADHNCEEHDA